MGSIKATLYELGFNALYNILCMNQLHDDKFQQAMESESALYFIVNNYTNIINEVTESHVIEYLKEEPIAQDVTTISLHTNGLKKSLMIYEDIWNEQWDVLGEDRIVLIKTKDEEAVREFLSKVAKHWVLRITKQLVLGIFI